MIAENVLQLLYTKNKTSIKKGLNVVLAHDSTTGYQLAIGNAYNKTFKVNNDSRKRLTTFIYEEKHFSLQGLNVVLAHDSNARLPLAIGILTKLLK